MATAVEEKQPELEATNAIAAASSTATTTSKTPTATSSCTNAYGEFSELDRFRFQKQTVLLVLF